MIYLEQNCKNWENSCNCGLKMAKITRDMIISRERGQLLLMIPI